MARVWHVLFMACFPASLLLLAIGAWPIGLAVFLLGTPLFWNLRNRAIEQQPYRGRRRPFVPPAGDVPDELRFVSPLDASKDEVEAALELGILHPQANYALVYNLAFEPQLQPNERPIGDNVLRPGFITSNTEAPPLPTRDDGGWVFITTAGVRWHFPQDGAPPTVPAADRKPGPRFIAYADIELNETEQTTTLGRGPIGPVVARVATASHVASDGKRWSHRLGLNDDGDTVELFAEIRARARSARADRA